MLRTVSDVSAKLDIAALTTNGIEKAFTILAVIVLQCHGKLFANLDFQFFVGVGPSPHFPSVSRASSGDGAEVRGNLSRQVVFYISVSYFRSLLQDGYHAVENRVDRSSRRKSDRLLWVWRPSVTTQVMPNDLMNFRLCPR
jgi:hypothetical protein